MTLKELAASRRISVPSAARLMRRRKWRRQPGNDGHIRVWVPTGEQEPKADDRADIRPDVSADSSSDVIADIRADALADVHASIMEFVRPLQDAIAVLEVQLTEANTRAARAEQAVTNERVRADVLRDRLETLQSELAAAQESARVAEGQTAALRQVEDARNASQAEAATLRADVEEAHRLVTAAQELAQAAEQAEATRAAARRGQGRWSRLRAAWRGE